MLRMYKRRGSAALADAGGMTMEIFQVVPSPLASAPKMSTECWKWSCLTRGAPSRPRSACDHTRCSKADVSGTLSAITWSAWQDDMARCYGELLRLCKDVVAAMHLNECKVYCHTMHTTTWPTAQRGAAKKIACEGAVITSFCECCHAVFGVMLCGVAPSFDPSFTGGTSEF